MSTLRRLLGVALPWVVLEVAGAASVAPDSVRPEAGLAVGAVIHDSIDYESFSIIQKVDAAGIASVVHWTVPDEKAPGGMRETSAHLLTRAADAASARRLITVHIPGDPESFPGATTGSVSRAIYTELKSAGESAVVIGATRSGGSPLADLLSGRKYYRGTLRRVEPQGVPMPVILDGQRVMIPALHARGEITVGADSGTAELWILDNADYPMTLKWTILGASAQVVRVDRPVVRASDPKGSGGGIALTQGLGTGACRAELHGVYFNTGSAALLPESAAALAQVADTLRTHADWQVLVEGHTDSIGQAAANLDLSRRRAESVRDALIRQPGIAADKLAARGFGAARPVESNDTVEGRARNRRVELSRQCK